MVIPEGRRKDIFWCHTSTFYTTLFQPVCPKAEEPRRRITLDNTAQVQSNMGYAFDQGIYYFTTLKQTFVLQYIFIDH